MAEVHSVFMTFILCTAVGVEIYEGKPAWCESQNQESLSHGYGIQGGCAEISGVLPKDDISLWVTAQFLLAY